MKGLKIIPLFLILIVLSYVGLLFVQMNPGDVVIVFFGNVETPPMALGFVVLTSALVGMIVAGILCLLELVVLYLQNKSMERKLKALGHPVGTSVEEVVENTNVTAAIPLDSDNGSGETHEADFLKNDPGLSTEDVLGEKEDSDKKNDPA